MMTTAMELIGAFLVLAVIALPPVPTRGGIYLERGMILLGLIIFFLGFILAHSTGGR